MSIHNSQFTIYDFTIQMDIICAISTPAGVGGIAVIRLSGTGAKEMAERFLFKGTSSAFEGICNPRYATFCQLRDGEELIDEVVATYFAGPHSYTGEDVVEISCHGSIYIQQRILRLFIDNGARLAEPGEFTQRAFLNGRLDLSQAEAVADLIDSQSESAHRLAMSQMRGGYAEELETLRQQLVDTAALLELELDFSDEDLEFVSRDRIRSSVEELKSRVESLVASFQMGNAIKNGIPVAIVGAPNVGKSTLLNRLLSEERAIVSDIPGTTRDTIEEQFVIDGMMFRLVDTAGIRSTDDEIENAGIERSKDAVRRAMIVLCVVDYTTTPLHHYTINEVANLMDLQTQKLIVVRNKIDIDGDYKSPLTEDGDYKSPSTDYKSPSTDYKSPSTDICCAAGMPHFLEVSAKYGTGIDELKKTMASQFQQFNNSNNSTITNLRHYEAMRRVLSALDEVIKDLDANLTPDLVVIDLRDALYHLGTITGKVTSDEILSSVFSRFCVGK